MWEGPGPVDTPRPGPPPDAHLPASPAPSFPRSGSDLGLQLTGRIEAAVGMVLLGLLQSGGSVLGQAMEQVTGGNLLSTLLIACAFTLSLVYLFRLAVGHMVQLPAGAVSAPQGPRLSGRAPERSPWRARGELVWRLQTPVLRLVLILAVAMVFLVPSLEPELGGCAGRRSFCCGSGFELLVRIVLCSVCAFQ